jgi:hypothetical protein
MLNVWELLELSTKVGLGGLVLTDHCSPNNSFYTNKVIVQTLKDMGLLKVPVIIGSEIKTPYGEFLLFGRKACSQWNQYKDSLDHINKSFGASAYWDMFKKFILHKVTHSKLASVFDSKVIQSLSYGMLMCHPRSVTVSWCEAMPQVFWDILHGFEIQNGFEEYDKINSDIVDYMQTKIKRCKCVRNSDCHAEELGSVFNEIPLKEFSENQLIHWLCS